MKKPITVILILISMQNAFAQDSEDYVSEETVAISTAVSAGIQLGTILESFLYNEPYYPYLFLGTAALQNTPGLILGTNNSIQNLLFQAGFDALYLGNHLIFGDNAATPLLFNAFHKFSMFSTYDTYAELRSRVNNEEYNNINRYSFFDLAAAPFKGNNYKEWYVWGYLGSIGIYSIVTACLADQSNAIWTTNEAYIGQSGFPVWAAVPLVLLMQIPHFIMTGVGEEALYRGTYYEELSYRLGEWPAKIIDGLYFTLSHYPQKYDELAETPPGNIISNALISMGQTFWLQYIYEWGDLPMAVTAHAATDVMLFFVDWLLQAGVPNNSGFSINGSKLSISLSL